MTTATPADMQAVRIGPTWRRNAAGAFLLPRHSIGWEQLRWAYEWLRHPDGPKAGEPWAFTDEQARLILWWGAVTPEGRFVYRTGALRRMKGWGKDPLGAVQCAIEFVGPARFKEWGPDGKPIATSVAKSWVQAVAVSQGQTRNTTLFFPSLFSPDALDEYEIDLGKEIIYGRGGSQIQAVTSSPKSLEGNQTTHALCNETEHWLKSNDGHDLIDVLRRNVAKTGGRIFSIFNAHQPGEDSVAERDWEAYLKVQSGESRATGLMYDSIEAPPDTVMADRESLARALAIARGDSAWVDIDRIIEEIYDPRTPPSTSRRFYLNQVVAAEDSWVTPQEWDACLVEGLALEDGDQVALFFDGSKSDDVTGLVACRITDGAVFRIASWARPEHGGEGWTVPRPQVTDAVAHAFARFDVVAFFADPGTGDDDTGARYWDALLDAWSQEYGDRICLWAVQSGMNRHPITWNMTDSAHQQLFTAAVERALGDIQERALPHDGDAQIRQHVANARRWPNRWGITIGKESRMSARKIDLAVCVIGARMIRRAYLALPEDKKRQQPGGFSYYVPGDEEE